jgi:SAM-dependent methyltransferase
MSESIRWEERYRTGDTPWDTGKPSSELQRVVAEDRITPCRALELGCGTGVNAVWLAGQGFDVTAVDLSPLAIERARQRAADAGVTVNFLSGDILNPPDLGEPFPFFFDRGCYHAVRRGDVSGYLRTVEGLTTPGTRALVLAGNANQDHDKGPPVVSEAEIRAELGSVFTIERLREFYFDEVAGVPQRFLGWSCLLKRPGG